ncbi:hypothetical protein BGX34_007858, partial [Mortierella sp. NVP85]
VPRVAWSSSRTPSVPSRRSLMASTITCPRLPSSWSVTLMMPLPRPRRSPLKSLAT